LYAQQSTPEEKRTLFLLDSLATQDVPMGAPGIATGMVRQGQITYEEYAGFAHLEDSIKIGPETRFNIASNGKQFTALAVLFLEEQGKIRLQDRISRYFPDVPVAVKYPVTIAQLLTHSSGLRDVYDLISLQGITWWEKPYSNQDVITLLTKQQDLNFAPGSKYLYSNSNYLLLAELISRVSAKSFAAFTNEMFQQLGMPNTSFETNGPPIHNAWARPYFNFNTWQTYPWIWKAAGDGNLFSTLPDLLHWEQVIQGKKQTSVSASIIRKSQQLIEGTGIHNYGYRLEHGTYKGKDCVYHEGATGAWKATVIRFTREQLAIVTLTNSGKTIPSMQTRQMADILMPVNNPSTPTINQPEKYGSFLDTDSLPGIYHNGGSFYFLIEKRENNLFLLRAGRNDIRLDREGPNVFHQWNDSTFKLEFSRNPKGDMIVRAYHPTHEPYNLTRTTTDFKDFDTKNLEGLFKNEETGAQLMIKAVSGKNPEITLGGNTYPGLMISTTQIIAGGYLLKRSENGDWLLDGDRIINVKFEVLKNN
jgi:CubicO group peptidase (beta-lactamase class C family)